MYLRPLAVYLAFVACLSTLHSCRKQSATVPATSAVTAKMGGVRNWHRSHYYHAFGIHFPTPVHESYMLSDTAFALIVIDDSTVQFNGHNFQYEQTDTLNEVYFFGMAYYFYKYRSGEGVAYFYKKDSIVHCYGDVHGTSDSWEIRDLYYTY